MLNGLDSSTDTVTFGLTITPLRPDSISAVSVIGVLPAASMSLRNGSVIRPSLRTRGRLDALSSLYTCTLSKSPTRITYSPGADASTPLNWSTSIDPVVLAHAWKNPVRQLTRTTQAALHLTPRRSACDPPVDCCMTATSIAHGSAHD